MCIRDRGHIKLVREALIERDEWQRIAPNATRVERFFFPVYSNSQRGRTTLFAGTFLYQWLAGRFSLGKSRLHSKQDLLKTFPELNSENLRGGVSYCDLVMDDKALAAILLGEARSSGVNIYPNSPVSNLTTSGTLEANGDELSFDHIINATGPWASDVLTQANIQSRFDVEHVRGSHLLLELSLPHALVFQVPTDNRIVFCIPQSADEVLLGTTEHPHRLEEPIECSEVEVDYLLAVLNEHLTFSVGRDRIKTTLSGLRPIAKTRQAEVSNLSTASRDSEIEVTDSLINVFGGKWTSARHLGHKVAALI